MYYTSGKMSSHFRRMNFQSHTDRLRTNKKYIRNNIPPKGNYQSKELNNGTACKKTVKNHKNNDRSDKKMRWGGVQWSGCK